ncbi:hypothetical protein F7725_010097 [Dissostichus mawsoni]|uniref:Uncharacterized protein n=1 Tax=Dissostichus mawsoni TaxID=36200 RepID=A0A7J5XP64_DISMA|nr:hypothetical protein F7725_010097 [Dissostichus mawsoni]
MRLSRKITDTDTMAISRYRFKSEKLSSFVGTLADREGSPLSETNTTKGEVIRKQRIVSRVCVYSPDLCHKVSRLSRIGMLSLLTEPCSE